MPLMLACAPCLGADWVSNPALQAGVPGVAGIDFIVNGAAPAGISALITASAELRLDATPGRC